MDNVSNDVFGGIRRLDVVNTGRRRRWTDEAKLRIVTEAFESGISVSTAARRHAVDRSQIYDWRQRLFARVPKGGGFVPVVVTPEVPVPVAQYGPSLRGQMEIVCGNGRRIIFDRDVDVAALRWVLEGIER